MVNEPIPVWFKATVADGLQRLMALSLDGHPAAETIKATAKAWTDALYTLPIQWDQHEDQERLDAAFINLSRTAERWPAPSHIVKAMPNRAEPARLPLPKLSKAELLERQARWKALIKQLKLK